MCQYYLNVSILLGCVTQDGRLPDAMRPVCADVEEEEEEDDDAGQTLSHDDHAALELPSIDPTQRVDISKNLAGMGSMYCVEPIYSVCIQHKKRMNDKKTHLQHKNHSFALG